MSGGRRACIALMLALVLSAVTSCTPAGETAANTGRSTNTTRLRVSGSGTCLPLLRVLTREYTDKTVTFVYLPGLHSGGGIKGVDQGDLEIGAVSRDLDATESALGLRLTLLSNDGLVIATNKSVTIDGLTTAQVRDIYAGKIRNWKQLGGPDMSINVLDRNEDESAKIILRKYVLGELGKPGSVQVTPLAIRLYYEPDMVEALTSTSGAIGYFSLGYGLSENIPVNLLKLDGVAATVENVQNGSYKVIRPLGVVLPDRPDPKAEAFVKWAAGPEASAIMKEHGYAPVER